MGYEQMKVSVGVLLRGLVWTIGGFGGGQVIRFATNTAEGGSVGAYSPKYQGPLSASARRAGIVKISWLQALRVSDRLLATFRRKIRVFGRMAYGGGKGKSPPGGAWRAGAAKIAGWRL
jgi:hypothetical protein